MDLISDLVLGGWIVLVRDWECVGWMHLAKYTRVCPKVSGLAAWSKNCKWYSSVPLDAIASLFYESV
jgi:hypothetical protein